MQASETAVLRRAISCHQSTTDLAAEAKIPSSRNMDAIQHTFKPLGQAGIRDVGLTFVCCTAYISLQNKDSQVGCSLSHFCMRRLRGSVGFSDHLCTHALDILLGQTNNQRSYTECQTRELSKVRTKSSDVLPIHLKHHSSAGLQLGNRILTVRVQDTV